MLEFKKLTLDSKSVFEKYTKFKYEASETSFANIFIWKDFFDVKLPYSEQKNNFKINELFLILLLFILNVFIKIKFVLKNR